MKNIKIITGTPPPPPSPYPSYDFDVFISHSSEDKTVICDIVKDFSDANLKCWVDHEQIKYGDRITEKIEDGLTKSRHILVCLSNNLGKSNWCKAEYGPLLNKSFSEVSDRRVIPLRLDDCTDDNIPSLLYDIKRANYSKKEEYKELIEFLKIKVV